MALEIEQERIDAGDVTWVEFLYLRDRGRWPSDVEPPEPDPDDTPHNYVPPVVVPKYTPLEDQDVIEFDEEMELEDEPAETEYTPLEDQDTIEFDEETELETEAAESRYTPLEDQELPKIQAKGGIVDDEAEDYEEGWNNDQRMGELSKRGLSVTGRKADLIARLIRSDNKELESDDYAEE